MKLNIREGIFETNSSSEHSITVMRHDKYSKWKLGTILARIKCKHNADNCWGNFWSTMDVLEFTDNFEKAKKDNERIVDEYKAKHLNDLEELKNKCLSYNKRIEKVLTDEELEKLSEKELHKYEDDLYEDELHHFNEESYNKWKEIYTNLTVDNFFDTAGICNGIWFTYEQFIADLKVDCNSPFEHVDIDDNIHIIGKYFHS